MKEFIQNPSDKILKKQLKKEEIYDISIARNVLMIEAAALSALAAALGENFIAALDKITSISGKVIVSGMGKSGHVARKIAATLASTGTPAFFVHPAEASHGDLGMIAREDVVIALSNSGETGELTNLVSYTRRFAISLIAITSCRYSSLSIAADTTIILPKVNEACPLGLAPTTSTTLMLALGDALAVTLLARRGFSTADFQLFHPGGHLGQKLLKVADLMHKGNQVPLVSGEWSMADVIPVITQKSLGCVGVVDDTGVLLGVITDGDLRRHMSPTLLSQTAQTVMTCNPKSIHSNVLAVEALRLMNDSNITSLFVLTEDRHPVGLIHMHDCLRAGIT